MKVSTAAKALGERCGAHAPLTPAGHDLPDEAGLNRTGVTKRAPL